MHSNKFRFESDLKCRAICSSREGEIKQFRLESDMKCGGPTISKGIIDFGGIQSNKFRFESDLKCRTICCSRDGEIKQFRFESDMKCGAFPFLKESLILGNPIKQIQI